MPRGAGANAGRSTSTRQSKQNQEPSSTRSKSQASTTAAASSDATPYLVALAGVRALESHVQDSSRGRKWKDRVSSWEERAGLGVPATKLALGFLDVLGVRASALLAIPKSYDITNVGASLAPPSRKHTRDWSL